MWSRVHGDLQIDVAATRLCGLLPGVRGLAPTAKRRRRFAANTCPCQTISKITLPHRRPPRASLRTRVETDGQSQWHYPPILSGSRLSAWQHARAFESANPTTARETRANDERSPCFRLCGRTAHTRIMTPAGRLSIYNIQNYEHNIEVAGVAPVGSALTFPAVLQSLGYLIASAPCAGSGRWRPSARRASPARRFRHVRAPR